MKLVKAKLLDKGVVCTCALKDFEPKAGDFVVVSTPTGPKLAQVLGLPFDCEVKGEPPPLVLKRADKRDFKRHDQMRQRETYAFRLCKAFIEELKLPMKLVDVESIPSEKKMVFFFTSETRVDFRTLVKKLAAKLKLRIEMRQIGVRDEAKIQGGIGPCGREICCKSFLKSFDTVTIRMAKEQNLPLNPERISGLCGRLMCCITFEMDVYHEIGEELPKSGKKVLTPYGEGKVVRQNVLLKTLTVELKDGTMVTLPFEEVKPLEE